jgi:amino acid permease
MKRDSLTREQRRKIWREMRAPTFAFVALMLFLGGIVLLGSLAPSHISSIIEFSLLIAMVLTMLLFTMEVREEDALMRFFSLIGFSWAAALFSFSMLDYLTR